MFFDYDKNLFMFVKMKIIDVLCYEYFDKGDYLDYVNYFMYGDKESVFLFYILIKSLDFFQVNDFFGLVN